MEVRDGEGESVGEEKGRGEGVLVGGSVAVGEGAAVGEGLGVTLGGAAWDGTGLWMGVTTCTPHAAVSRSMPTSQAMIIVRILGF